MHDVTHARRKGQVADGAVLGTTVPSSLLFQHPTSKQTAVGTFCACVLRATAMTLNMTSTNHTTELPKAATVPYAFRCSQGLPHTKQVVTLGHPLTYAVCLEWVLLLFRLNEQKTLQDRKSGAALSAGG